MLAFNTEEELKACKELQNMGRYEHQNVMLDGKEVIACTTNQQYEDIIWGAVYDMLEELEKEYEFSTDKSDIAAETRDFVLDKLKKYSKVEFVDVFDEY